MWIWFVVDAGDIDRRRVLSTRIHAYTLRRAAPPRCQLISFEGRAHLPGRRGPATCSLPPVDRRRTRDSNGRSLPPVDRRRTRDDNGRGAPTGDQRGLMFWFRWNTLSGS